MTDKSSRLRTFVESEAKRLGFDDVGIAPASADPKLAEHLNIYIDHNFHGTMEWMRETAERRAAPQAMWSDAKSCIVLAMNYGPAQDPTVSLENSDKGNISVYARNRDYHDVIKGKLKELAAKLVSRARELELDEPGSPEVKVFVDTAPLMEKPLAARAGLGWQGKHTNLVSRDLGSWFFLGTILTNVDLHADEAEEDHCGSCRSCLDACPTKAFPAPYQIDARRCISYLTIEHKGAIPHEFRAAMGNRIYGCDDCLAACPWNKFAEQASEAKLAAPDDWEDPDLVDLLALDDAAFRKRFSGSPVKRIGRNRFIRNCLIAAGNSANPDLLSLVETLRTDDDPIVRDAAEWARGRLMEQSS